MMSFINIMSVDNKHIKVIELEQCCLQKGKLGEST